MAWVYKNREWHMIYKEEMTKPQQKKNPQKNPQTSEKEG